jgi:hypothetical protein
MHKELKEKRERLAKMNADKRPVAATASTVLTVKDKRGRGF